MPRSPASRALGRREDVAKSLPPALVLAERAGTFRTVGLLATAAEACYLQGAWDDALVHLAGIEPEFLGNWSNLNPAALAALIALHRGGREKADEYLAATGVDEPPAGPGSAANWRLTAAWALRAESAGDTGRALELMATWLDPAPIPGQETRHELLPHLVRVALDQGDRDLAAAGSYLEHGWPLERATALEEAAVRLAAGGDLTQARAVFNDVIKLYFGLGASWDLRRTEARLRPHGIRRGPRPQPPAGHRLGGPHPVRDPHRRAGRSRPVQPRHRRRALRLPPHRPDPRLQHPDQAGPPLPRGSSPRIRQPRRVRERLRASGPGTMGR